MLTMILADARQLNNRYLSTERNPTVKADWVKARTDRPTDRQTDKDMKPYMYFIDLTRSHHWYGTTAYLLVNKTDVIVYS